MLICAVECGQHAVPERFEFREVLGVGNRNVVGVDEVAIRDLDADVASTEVAILSTRKSPVRLPDKDVSAVAHVQLVERGGADVDVDGLCIAGGGIGRAAGAKAADGAEIAVKMIAPP